MILGSNIEHMENYSVNKNKSSLNFEEEPVMSRSKKEKKGREMYSRDTILDCIENMVTSGEGGVNFKVDGENYSAKELLEHLKKGDADAVGVAFRRQVCDGVIRKLVIS